MSDSEQELVREFDTARPLELDVSTTLGPLRIELAETTTTRVEVRHDATAAALDWRGGLTGLLTWVSGQLGESSGRTVERLGPERLRAAREVPVAEALGATRVELTGNRLVVRTPSTAPLRAVPLAVAVTAPVDSQITVRTGSGGADVFGRAGKAQVQAGSGEVSVEEVAGSAVARTGSGQLRLGEVRGGLQVRSGSGDVEIAAVDGASSVVTGSGSVWLGQLHGDVLVRSGSGDLSIADAVRGRAELITGSGHLRVAVHEDVAAEVDLTSSSGTASSDLEVSEQPPESEPLLRIYGRTGNGDALVTTAL
jgi:hypothetical protein